MSLLSEMQPLLGAMVRICFSRNAEVLKTDLERACESVYSVEMSHIDPWTFRFYIACLRSGMRLTHYIFMCDNEHIRHRALLQEAHEAINNSVLVGYYKHL